MKLEGGRIPSSQLTILAIGFLLGSSIILGPGGAAENNAWLAVLFGLGEGLVFLSIYVQLQKNYPHKTLIEMNDIIYGPYLGKLFSICYIIFFLHTASLVVRSFGAFFGIILVSTPLSLLLISILLVCAYAVRNGIEVIARCSLLLVVLMIIVTIFNTALVAINMEPSNLLPFMDIPIQEFFKASHSISTLPFGQTIVFLMIVAFLNQQQEAGPSLLKAFLISGLIFLIIALRNPMVMGPQIYLATYPSFAVVRSINIADILTRLDILIGVSFLGAGFLKITVLYYGAVLGIAQILNMRSYLPLVLPIGALILGVSLLQYDAYIYDINDALKYYPYYSLPFEFFLPLITLVAAKIRTYLQASPGGKV